LINDKNLLFKYILNENITLENSESEGLKSEALLTINLVFADFFSGNFDS
jgi:hypothetical protein